MTPLSNLSRFSPTATGRIHSQPVASAGPGEQFTPTGEQQYATPPKVYTPPGTTAKPRMSGWRLAVGGGLVALLAAGALMGPLGPATSHVNQPTQTVAVSSTVVEHKNPSGFESMRVGELSQRAFPRGAEVSIQGDSAVIPSADGHRLDYQGGRLVGGEGQVLLDGTQSQFEFIDAFQSDSQGDWSLNYKLTPAGGRDNLVSVGISVETQSEGPPNQDVQLATFDRNSGQRVHLSDLVGQDRFEAIVSTVSGKLGADFSRPGDDLRMYVDQSFSVSPDGKVTVAIPGSNEASEGRVTEFVFQAL